MSEIRVSHSGGGRARVEVRKGRNVVSVSTIEPGASVDVELPESGSVRIRLGAPGEAVEQLDGAKAE